MICEQVWLVARRWFVFRVVCRVGAPCLVSCDCLISSVPSFYFLAATDNELLKNTLLTTPEMEVADVLHHVSELRREVTELESMNASLQSDAASPAIAVRSRVLDASCSDGKKGRGGM